MFKPGQANLNPTTNVFKKTIAFGDEVVLDIRGLQLPADALDSDAGVLTIAEKIYYTVTISVDNPNISLSELQQEMKFKFEAGIRNVNFSKIYGFLDYQIDLGDDMETIDLSDLFNDLPQLNRDSLTLDVNPYLILTTKSNLQIPMGAEVSLVPFTNGIKGAPVDIKIPVPKATSSQQKETNFWISDVLPPDQSYVHITPENGVKLSSIIKKIPDSIQINVGGGIKPTEQVIFDFTEEYLADLSYKFVVPLSVGPDFKIFVQDTMKDLSASVGQLLNGNKIALTAFVVNNIPLDLEASVILIDSLNRPIAGVSVSPFIIRAGSTLQSEPARLEISASKDSKIDDMRGLIWQFKATAPKNPDMAGKLLNPNNFIQLKLQAEIHGGVVVDLRELMNNDKED
jgi:hypothetical protein